METLSLNVSQPRTTEGFTVSGRLLPTLCLLSERSDHFFAKPIVIFFCNAQKSLHNFTAEAWWNWWKAQKRHQLEKISPKKLRLLSLKKLFDFENKELEANNRCSKQNAYSSNKSLLLPSLTVCLDMELSCLFQSRLLHTTKSWLPNHLRNKIFQNMQLNKTPRTKMIRWKMDWTKEVAKAVFIVD